MVDELHEECGVIGIWGLPRAVHAATMGLHAMQHRGQESSGVAVSDGLDVRHVRAMGLVSRLTEQLASLPELPGSAAIGHVRYSTAGGSLLSSSRV